MSQTRKLARLAALWAVVLLSAAGTWAKPDDKKKKMPSGTPVLWQAVDVGERDLFWGPGGEQGQPDLRHVKFIKQEEGGYSTKYRIRDWAGREWVAKIGSEAQSETAAVRLLWGLGYQTEINYLVPKLTIPGQGTFSNARLEARPKGVKRLDEWSWKDNPFEGTDELQGLKVMMAFLTNWDLKDTNNKILLVRGPQGNELRYVISDLGATFGKTGNLPLLWRVQRSRNNPDDYAEAGFVEEVKEDHVKFRYGGKMRELFDDITVDQTVWLSNLLAQLSEQQISDAFRAAQYTPEEITLLTDSVKRRRAELNSVMQREASRP